MTEPKKDQMLIIVDFNIKVPNGGPRTTFYDQVELYEI